MAASIPGRARAWLDVAEYAVLATVEPDGRPQLSVERFAADDGTDRVRVVLRLTPDRVVLRD